jgi:TPR repeat protein
LDSELDKVKKEAEEGYLGAQCRLASMYFEGEGVTQDDKKAFKWFRKAAKQGHADAQFHMGWMHEMGRTKNGPNEKEAIVCYIKASKLGCIKSFYHLGLVFTKDKKSYDRAYTYFLLVRWLGEEDIDQSLNTIKKLITEAELSAAKSKAADRLTELIVNGHIQLKHQ